MTSRWRLRLGRPRVTLRRLIAVALVAVLVAGLGGYGFASNLVFDKATVLDVGWCDSAFAGNTPASFSTTVQSTVPYVDTTPYRMTDYQTVTIPSRQPGFSLKAWWIPAAGTNAAEARTVLLIHGREKCMRDAQVLLPAGMLHRAGFSVLLIDMRQHGGSTKTDGRWDFAVDSYEDVLGAWDWLQSAQHVPAPRIGLFGVSYGAASVIEAMGEEPRVAAAWEEASWSDTPAFIGDLLRLNGYPEILAPGAILAGRLRGIDVTKRTPLADAARIGNRPFYIVHGDADSTIPVKHAYVLADAIRASGGKVEPWILPGVEHVRAAFVATAEYERRLDAFFEAALR